MLDWLIDRLIDWFDSPSKNCPTGMISGWVQKMTEHHGTIQYTTVTSLTWPEPERPHSTTRVFMSRSTASVFGGVVMMSFFTLAVRLRLSPLHEKTTEKHVAVNQLSPKQLVHPWLIDWLIESFCGESALRVVRLIHWLTRIPGCPLRAQPIKQTGVCLRLKFFRRNELTFWCFCAD